MSQAICHGMTLLRGRQVLLRSRHPFIGHLIIQIVMILSHWWIVTCVIWITKFIAAEELTRESDDYLGYHAEDI